MESTTLEDGVVKEPTTKKISDSVSIEPIIPNGVNGMLDANELDEDAADGDIIPEKLNDVKEKSNDNNVDDKVKSLSNCDQDDLEDEEEEEEEDDEELERDQTDKIVSNNSVRGEKLDEGMEVDETNTNDKIDNSEVVTDQNSEKLNDIDKSASSKKDTVVDSEVNNERKDTQDNDDEIMEVDSSKSTGSDIECLESDDPISKSQVEENGGLSSPDIEEISNGQHKSDDSPKKKQKNKVVDLTVTPRRSSRNIKRTSYTELADDKEPRREIEEDTSDIEEIKPVDPLADLGQPPPRRSMKISPSNSKTIVVNDTKRLVEIAAGSKCSKGNKKEPTLVIIDTNSILSGKGGVPVASSTPSRSLHSSHSSHSNFHHSLPNSSSISMVPINMSGGSQPLNYSNMRTSITPIPMKSQLGNHQIGPKTTISPIISAPPPLAPPQISPQILPTLTDDMFVVEAPSFIVPYVYEKPPIKPLKDFVKKLKTEIDKATEEEKAAAKAKEPEAESEDGVMDLTDKKDSSVEEISEEKSTAGKPQSYFDMPLGKFFMQIGMNLVQEFVQTDLLRTQKRKIGKNTPNQETQMAINSLIKNLEFSKENNEPFHHELKKCQFCNFKTESSLAMQHHLETPHMKNYMYKCNFCPTEVRSPHEILFHMEEEHNERGRLERGPAFHQCPNCPFEDNQKGKLSRHILTCQKKFKPEKNLEPSLDWEPPAKIPRLNRPRAVGPNPASSAFAMAAMNAMKNQQQLLPKLLPAPQMPGRGRGRPPMQPRFPDMKAMGRPGQPLRQDNYSSMIYRPTSSGMMMPSSYPMNVQNQIFQVMGSSGTVISAMPGFSSSGSGSSGRPTPVSLLSSVNEAHSKLLSSQNTSVTVKNPTAKLLNQPSISITPLPRTTPQTPSPGSGSSSKSTGKNNTFVICEICDGYIKDLEQLRNHMQWIHKVKIHPKMIYNRPPLNCQKCQFRFFTDQGLERHLLGSHGLVTSSMQEAANKGKDAGRCPACGRVYQWKLLNHVARDHGMTLKPAHLSYKCTVCTATFGMYKQFENHVYSAHSVVAKRVMDKKAPVATPSPRSNDSLLKPLKINDEITIIPQPAKPSNRASQGRGK